MEIFFPAARYDEPTKVGSPTVKWSVGNGFYRFSSSKTRWEKVKFCTNTWEWLAANHFTKAGKWKMVWIDFLAFFCMWSPAKQRANGASSLVPSIWECHNQCWQMLMDVAAFGPCYTCLCLLGARKRVQNVKRAPNVKFVRAKLPPDQN